MRHLLRALLALVLIAAPLSAQTSAEAGSETGSGTGPVQALLQSNSAMIIKSSRKTIQPVIDQLADSGLPQAQTVLQRWQAREIWLRKEDGLFFYGTEIEKKVIRLFDFDTSAQTGDYSTKALKQIKPNSGVRALIATALVRFQLSDPDPALRLAALKSIERDPAPELLAPLRASLVSEASADILARKNRLNALLTLSFDTDTNARLAAMDQIAGELDVPVRAALNQLLGTRLKFAPDSIPDHENVAMLHKIGAGIATQTAYDMLVDAGFAAAETTSDDIRKALSAHVADGQVGGVALADLGDPAMRQMAYDALAQAGAVPPRVSKTQRDATLGTYVFYDAYDEPSKPVTDAASKTLREIETLVGVNQVLDLGLDALSLASIYFLAAIGLAITFGVMGVINMAHGEFIMMGAYTGYVVQQIIPDYTISILVALPAAFAVTFAAGVAMERLIIRWLYHRPLETLLATFGVSIALQQLAKNIFGTQARPLTAPGWLDGAWVMNDVVSISYVRIAIFVLALVFLGLFLFIMNRTRLGLETRAVTQNPRMAAGMGINPDRVNMLTFGLGSGIAGVAGVAIGLYAKVTSELGSDYIVQSFMTVVVGGVGNIWGALLGATMVGFLQKGIEWMNPSNTLAAQTYMIIFIIIFIQFRPRGIIALKGRAAGD